VLAQQRGEGGGLEHRDVAVGDQHRPGEPGGQRVEPAADGVPGTQALLLLGGQDRPGQLPAEPGDGTAHLVTAVPDDHDEVLGQRGPGADGGFLTRRSPTSRGCGAIDVVAEFDTDFAGGMLQRHDGLQGPHGGSRVGRTAGRIASCPAPPTVMI
jgi:hypothetical protein